MIRARIFQVLVGVLVLMGGVAVPTSAGGAEKGEPAQAGEPIRFGQRARNPEFRHCAIQVTLGPAGRYVPSTEVCFETLTEVDASLGRPLSGASTMQTASSSATQQLIGRHYDGPGFTGPSLSLYGIDCVGGHLPLESDNYWNNRISSSTGGCTRLAHYDTQQLTSEREDTVMGGTLTTLDNRVGMIAYHYDLDADNSAERVGAARFADVVRINNGTFSRQGFDIDIDVISGPSAGQAVTCTPLFTLPSPFATQCATSESGALRYSYEPIPGVGTDVVRFRVTYPGTSTTRTVHQNVEWLPSVDYDALGDSYSSGEGVGTDGEPVWLDDPQSGDKCHRSPEAYQHLLTLPNERNPLSRVFGAASNSLSFVACGGATTRNINIGGVGQFGEPAQLEDPGVGTTADLITLTIGGNDAAFSKVLTYCATSRNECDDPTIAFEGYPSFEDWAEDLITDVGTQVGNTYQQIKEVTGGAPTFVLGYPQLFPDTPAEQSCTLLRLSNRRAPGIIGELGFTQSEQSMLRLLTSQLNAELASAAANVGVHFIPVNNVTSQWDFDGHEVCASSDDEWVWGPVVRSSRKSYSFHPKAKGHEAYAGLLHDHIAGLLDGGSATNAQGIPVNPAPGGGDAPAPTMSFASMSSPVSVHVPLGVTAPAACGIAVPGGSVDVVADGFGPAATVTIEVISDTTNNASPAVVNADSTGRVVASVPVPTDNESDTLALEATGPAGADTLVAFGSIPVWAGSPCPQADVTTVSVPGQQTTVDVLTNDSYPTGATIQIVDDPPGGATFAVSGSTVTITGTDSVGTEVAVYAVCDSYDFCVDASITLTVDPGCTIWGTNGDDYLTGTSGDDVICALDGNDVIDAGAGNDTIWAGTGDDTIFAGGGDDVVYLGPGTDTAELGPGADIAPDAEAADTVSDPPEETDAPSVTVAAPADGAVVAQGSYATANFSCDDPGTEPSGVAACVARVIAPDNSDSFIRSGSALPTGTLGVHTVEVVAVDWAGNQTTTTVTYEVVPWASVVVGDPTALTSADIDLVRLIEGAGFIATTVDDDGPTIRDVVVVAPSADRRKTSSLASVPVGLLALSADDLKGLGLTARNGRTTNATSVNAQSTHPVMAGITPGTVAHVTNPWATVAIQSGDLGAGAQVHATVAGNAAVFTYDTGAARPAGPSPARRALVGWEDAPATVLTADGVQIVENALQWLLAG